MKPRDALELCEEFFHSQSSMPNEGAQSANRELFVLRNREINSKTRFCHHYVTANLPGHVLSGLLKGSYRFLPGNVCQSRHRITR